MKRIEILVNDEDVQKVLDAVVETGVVVGMAVLDAGAGLEKEGENDQKTEA